MSITRNFLNCGGPLFDGGKLLLRIPPNDIESLPLSPVLVHLYGRRIDSAGELVASFPRKLPFVSPSCETIRFRGRDAAVPFAPN